MRGDAQATLITAKICSKCDEVSKDGADKGKKNDRLQKKISDKKVWPTVAGGMT